MRGGEERGIRGIVGGVISPSTSLTRASITHASTQTRSAFRDTSLPFRRVWLSLSPRGHFQLKRGGERPVERLPTAEVNRAEWMRLCGVSFCLIGTQCGRWLLDRPVGRAEATWPTTYSVFC